MKKCLRISFSADVSLDYVRNTIQKQAQKLRLEGTGLQDPEDNKIKLVLCGDIEAVDSFVDFLHKESIKLNMEDLEIEPFIKTKDYRGIFRVIE